jgi:hypothetical protein
MSILSDACVCVVLLLPAGCGCGSVQRSSFTVYLTEAQFHALEDDDGIFETDTCIAVCEHEERLETIDGCTTSLVSAAVGADTGDTGAEGGMVVTLECAGTTRMECY